MSDRGAAEIREEIATERQRLDDNLSALEGELLSGAPFVLGGLAALGAVVLVATRKRGHKRKTPTGFTVSWKFK
jgi:hypothetical protein